MYLKVKFGESIFIFELHILPSAQIPYVYLPTVAQFLKKCHYVILCSICMLQKMHIYSL